MIIAPTAAQTFIDNYSPLMTKIAVKTSSKKAYTIAEIIYRGRRCFLANRSGLELACQRLAADGYTLSDAVLAAVHSLQVKQWVYLKDTRSHSILLDLDGQNAYGVLGLTERLRAITGASGVIVETGVMCYEGKYVTDGIVSCGAWLGPNYRRSYTQRLAELRQAGRYHISCCTRS